MRVHFVVHEAFESPGAYEAWARARGHETTYSRVHAHEPLPQEVDGIDLLLVMGGPQSPATTREECPHFDSAAEQALISRCITAGKAVVGVCLGSQLLGAALGAPHEHSPEKEIGKLPITLTAAGRADPKLAGFGETLDVGHWHNDMPGLTSDAKILAYSEGCPRQIVAYGELVYGLQCHMEFTPEQIDLLIGASAEELADGAGSRFVQQAPALRANDYAVMNAALSGFLDRLVEAYRARP